MRQQQLVGKAQTVLGPIDADCLGVTLPHEHLLTDLTAYFVEPIGASERKLAHEPVRIDNLHWVKTHYLNHLEDLQFMDEELAIKEVTMFKLAGGDTVVEMSNIGLHRDPLGLARISRASGLNVIMGAAYYISLSHPPELANMSEEEIAEGIVRDILLGVGDTGVHAGIIGEVGCSFPLEDSERKVLRACAIAQQQTGAAISLHPSPNNEAVLEIVKILGDAGANLSRTVIGHVDVWAFSRATLRKLANAGCYIEYDTFGRPGPMPIYLGQVLDAPSDTQRINDIIELIAEGYLNHILISHDICHKHLLVSYGGYGYAHILRNIVPIMRSKGMSDEQIHTLLVENPKRALTFTSVKKD